MFDILFHIMGAVSEKDKRKPDRFLIAVMEIPRKKTETTSPANQ